jgi:hypothetical protein
VAFNGQVLDGYSQLSAEVVRLREKVAALERVRAQPAPVAEPGPPAVTPRPPPLTKAVTKKPSTKKPSPRKKA